MASTFTGKRSDIVLFLMGGTGAGKSTFINYVLDGVAQVCGTRMRVGESLAPCTGVLQPIRLLPSLGNQRAGLDRVVLVDGPGLEDNDVSQHEVLAAMVKNWLSSRYPSSFAPLPRRGIIFVQDISISPLISLATFQNLQATINLTIALGCGDILLATMKWGKMTDAESERAEEGLKRRTWKRLIDAGVPLRSIKSEGERNCALSVVEYFFQLTDAQRHKNMEVLQGRVPTASPMTLRVDDSALSLLPTCGRCEDIIILVMGALKSGKSSFINRILEHCGRTPSMEVSDDLTLCTDSVESTIVKSDMFICMGSRRVVLVDTPGLEADGLENLEVLRLIHSWFHERFEERVASCAIIYLHDISHDGFSRTAGRVLDLFPAVIRNISVRKRFLITTKWDNHLKTACISRETQLLSRAWSSLVGRGYAVRRLSGHVGATDAMSNHLEIITEAIRAFS